MNSPAATQPKISVVILNYNGQEWLPRCFESLEAQTIFPDIEVIVSDNKSVDGSDQFATAWLERTGKGRVVQNGANLYYCEANNNGAAVASGEFLLFLNNDTWLESDCLAKLYHETARADADGAAPMVLNYDDNTFQAGGESGIDFFGIPTSGPAATRVTETFASPGCSLFVRTETFRRIGGFPPELLIYADETDLAWRVWISGGKIICVPTAKVHHRGAAVANPLGSTKTVESRTTDTKRFLANRNGILFLLKNPQHFLLLLLIPHLFLLLVEAMISFALVRRWGYIRRSYLGAVSEAFRMRSHVRKWRRQIAGFRQRGDFEMLRFLRLKPARWDEVTRLMKYGAPKVDSR